MIDIDLIRQDKEKIKNAVKQKQLDPSLVDEAVVLDNEWRKALQAVEDLRREKNELSKKRTPEAITKAKKVKKDLKKLEKDLKSLEEKREKALLLIPNMAADDVREGSDESGNEVIEKVKEPPEFDFKPRDHVELGKMLDIIDIERASKVSGARFAYLKNEGVLLEFALVSHAINTLMSEGFVPIIPPEMVKVDTFEKLGYSEHLGNENYYLVKGGNKKKSKGEEEGEYYLVGTAEHSIVPYFMDETLKSADLPKRFVGFSTSFRREAGSYGKDTKGILRVHQFDKVEMVSVAHPDEGDKEHDYLLSMEKKLFDALEIPYQVVKMCTGDLGAPVARKYDIEAWVPSQNKYREMTSTSTTTDFQSRRLNIKYQEKGKTDYVHLLNGTAYAIGRTIIAILENYQQVDGSVIVPKVLRDYLGKDKIETKK